MAIQEINSHIYVLTDVNCKTDLSDLFDDYTVKVWRPSLVRFVPPGMPKKYLMYWFFHMLGVFKNKNYCAIQVYHKGREVSHSLLVPAYFKWPFMAANDLQYTYSGTIPAYRGKGLNRMVKNFARRLFENKEIKFWSVVAVNNKTKPSLTGVDMKFFSEAVRKKPRFFPFIKIVAPIHNKKI